MMKAEAERGRVREKGEQAITTGGPPSFPEHSLSQAAGAGSQDRETERQSLSAFHTVALGVCSACPNTHTHPSLPRIGPALECSLFFLSSKEYPLNASVSRSCTRHSPLFIHNSPSKYPVCESECPRAQSLEAARLSGLVPPATNYFSFPGDCCLLMFPWQY